MTSHNASIISVPNRTKFTPVYDLTNPADRLRLALDQPTRDRRRMVAHIVEWRQGKEARAELVAALRAQR